MNFENLHKLAGEHHGNICQIVVVKDGKTVYEDCYNGFKTTDTCHVMSATKSIVSLLVGMVIDKGLIEGVNQPILEFFPDYKIKRGEKTIQKITLKNLLTMTAPYKCKSEPWTKVCTSEDWTISALDLLGGKSKPIGNFQYSTLGIHILTGLIERVSQMRAMDFANKFLFEPLDIAPRKGFCAENAEEHKKFVISKTPKENLWFVDPKGVPTAGFGICLSAKEMANIGQMCLQNGEFGGQKILSKEWLEESTKAYVLCDEHFANMSYGYLWWIIDPQKHIYSAIGNSGNIIYINPTKNLVVSITATFKPTVFDRVPFVQQVVEPMLEL